MQHDGTRTRSYLIWLCVSFLIIDNVLALASPKPDTGAGLNSIPFVPGLNAQSHPKGLELKYRLSWLPSLSKKIQSLVQTPPGLVQPYPQKRFESFISFLLTRLFGRIMYQAFDLRLFTFRPSTRASWVADSRSHCTLPLWKFSKQVMRRRSIRREIMARRSVSGPVFWVMDLP